MSQGRKVYIIRDADTIRAVHQIYDSAMACFYMFIKKRSFVRFLDLMILQINEFGVVIDERSAISYSGSTRTLINYMAESPVMEVVADGGSGEEEEISLLVL
jgi:hypothetical protein